MGPTTIKKNLLSNILIKDHIYISTCSDAIVSYLSRWGGGKLFSQCFNSSNISLMNHDARDLKNSRKQKARHACSLLLPKFWPMFFIYFKKNPKKVRKSLKFKNIFFSSQPHLSIKTKFTGSNHVDQGKKWVSGCFRSKPSFPTKTEFTGSIQVKPCRPGLKMSSGLFQVKTVIFDQNRVHRVNMGQTVSTRVKNKFRAVSGQNHHFRPKPSSPGQYGSNHVDQV